MTDMVRVKMKQQMSGSRYDGRSWPDFGGEFDVPDWEAADLVIGGLADRVSPPAEVRAEVPAPEPAPVETRVTEPVKTTRATSGRPRA